VSEEWTHPAVCCGLASSEPGILTILVKSIANTNTNTFVTILFTVYYIQQRSFFPRSSINKFSRMIVVEKMAKSL